MAGLTAARLLSPHFQTAIYEKSGRLSGRCASLLFRGVVVDQGSPYFTLTKPMREFLDPILGTAVLKEVPGRIVPPHDDQEEQWYISSSANAIGAKLIAGCEENVTIHKNAKVIRHPISGLLQVEDEVISEDDNNNLILCTVPAPQAIELFPSVVTSRKYNPILAAALAYTGSVKDGVYARRWENSSTNCILLAVRETMKAGREKGGCIFLVHGTSKFSADHLEEADQEGWAEKLRDELEAKWPGVKRENFIGLKPKRWRYAYVAPGTHRLESKSPLVELCGDSVAERSGIEESIRTGIECAVRIGRRYNIDLSSWPLNLVSTPQQSKI